MFRSLADFNYFPCKIQIKTSHWMIEIHSDIGVRNFINDSGQRIPF